MGACREGGSATNLPGRAGWQTPNPPGGLGGGGRPRCVPCPAPEAGVWAVFRGAGHGLVLLLTSECVRSPLAGAVLGGRGCRGPAGHSAGSLWGPGAGAASGPVRGPAQAAWAARHHFQSLANVTNGGKSLFNVSFYLVSFRSPATPEPGWVDRFPGFQGPCWAVRRAPPRWAAVPRVPLFLPAELVPLMSGASSLSWTRAPGLRGRTGAS